MTVNFQRRCLWIIAIGCWLIFPSISQRLVAEDSSSKSDFITLKVYDLPTQSVSRPDKVAEYRVVQRFRELHPEIHLEATTLLLIQGGTEDFAPLMAIAGGTSPDVISVNFRQSDNYIQQGFLYPLDEYIKKIDKQELEERMPKSILPVAYREGPSGKHYWMMPQRVVAAILLYRRDLFAAAGLDPDRPPRNWQELHEYARKLTDPESGIYGLGFFTGPNASWGMFSYLCSAGAQAVKQLPNGEWRASFDTDEAVTAYEFVDRLQKEQVTRNGRTGNLACRDADLGMQWQNGKLAMSFDYLGAGRLGDKGFSSFNPELIGVGPIPEGPGGKSSGEVNAEMMGIFAGQKDKRVRDAAWEYIRFVSSTEAHKIFTQTMVELGSSRMVSPSWLKKFGFKELAKLVPPGLEEAFETAVANGTQEPYGKNCQYVYMMMDKPIEQSLYTDFQGMSHEQVRGKIKEYLKTAVSNANEKMMGVMPPDVRKSRNTIAWFVVVIVMTGFCTLIFMVFKWMHGTKPPMLEGESRYKTRLALTLIAPALLLILMWQYYPLARGSLIAFQNYSVMGGSPWVGINNFADVIFDPTFWFSLKNAIYFCLLWLTLGFFPPVLLAVMLQEIPVGRIFYRILFYLPAVVSSVVVLFMWKTIFDPSEIGILNRILVFFHIGPQTWLQNPHLAMFCVVFPLAWAMLGPNCIIYLAALKGIPDELYEASDIDGASFFDKLRYIVLPYLKPLLVINIVGATIYGLKSGDAILAMTGGGPDMATHVIGYEIFVRSFLFLKFGQGAAMAWILGVLLLAFTAYQLRILNKVEFRTANR